MIFFSSRLTRARLLQSARQALCSRRDEDPRTLSVSSFPFRILCPQTNFACHGVPLKFLRFTAPPPFLLTFRVPHFSSFPPSPATIRFVTSALIAANFFSTPYICNATCPILVFFLFRTTVLPFPFARYAVDYRIIRVLCPNFFYENCFFLFNQLDFLTS